MGFGLENRGSISGLGIKNPLRNYSRNVRIRSKATPAGTRLRTSTICPICRKTYGQGNRGNSVRSPAAEINFSLLRSIQIDSGAQPASYSVGTGVISSGIKGSELEAGHPSPSRLYYILCPGQESVG